MNRLLGATASILTLLPVVAQAQMTGDVTLSFGQSDIQNIDEDLTTSYLGLSMSGDLGSNVSAGFSFGLNRSSVDGFDADVDLQTFGADIGYRFGPGLTAGAYVQRESIDAPLLDGFGDFSATSLGLYAGYDAGAMAMTGFIGQTTTDPDLPDDADITDFGLSARFQPTEAAVVGGMLIRSNSTRARATPACRASASPAALR